MSYRLNNHISSDIDVPSYEKRLSICLRPNGFSFSVTSTGNILIAFGQAEHEGKSDMASLASDIKDFYQSIGLQSFGFNKVELVVPTNQSTLIPDDLYQDEKKQNYLHLLYNSLPLGSIIYSDHIESLGAYCVFAADSTIVTAFKIALPGIQIRSQFSKLSESDIVKESTPNICMHVREGWIDVMVSNGGKMLLVNSYAVANGSEMLSIGVEVMQQMNVEQPTTTLHICGEADRDLYMLLRNYFPQVKLYNGKQYRFANPEFQHLHTYQHVLTLI